MSVSYSGGLNFTGPSAGDTNWFSVLNAILTAISSHAHTGTGDGVTIASGALAANSVTGAKMLLGVGGEAFRGLDSTGTIQTDLFRYSSSNIFELLTTVAFSSTETLNANGALSLTKSISVLNGASLAMTLADGVAGQLKLVLNISATPATVTPATTAGVNTVALQQYGCALYLFLTSEWRCIGGVRSAMVDDVTTGLTAHAGGGQGSATALPSGLNEVSTVASAGDSCVLPSPYVRQVVVVGNTAAANSMNLFPASGHSINNLSANTQIAVAAGKVARCEALTTTKWLVSVA